MMENRYVDFRASVYAMEQDRTWVETPFFFACSAVFEMQFAMLVGRGELRLLASPEVMCLPSSHIAAVANVNNVHYMALHPMSTEGSNRRKCSSIVSIRTSVKILVLTLTFPE